MTEKESKTLADLMGGDFTPLAHPPDTHGAPVHPAAAAILSRQTGLVTLSAGLPSLTYSRPIPDDQNQL